MKRSKRKSVETVGKTLLHNKLNFAATEAYKLLRTNVIFTMPDNGKCHVVGVTSSIRGEGKSTTATNLSYALAETGKKVLLVDADLRLPSIAKKLEIASKPGLSNLVAGMSGDEAIVKWEGLENWHILPSGDIPPNPTEMLGSPQMAKIIEKYSEVYDFIILDLPPVNIVSDALIVSPLVDGMIVVVREDYSERRALMHCTKLLEMSNAKVLGFVMNVSREDSVGYSKYKRYKYYKYYSRYYKHGYYGHYGYGYGYGRSSHHKSRKDGETEK